MHKKITLLYATCYLDVSGVTKINLDILTRIASEAEIHICTTCIDDNIHDKWDDRFRINFRAPLKLWLISRRDRYQTIVDYLKNHGVDIIYITHSLWFYEHAARLKRDLPKIKIVDSLHVLEPYCFRGGYPDISANRFVHPYIDASILISRNLENYLLKNYPVDRKKLHIVHNGVDLALFRKNAGGMKRPEFLPAESGKVVGFIGRFADQKRPLFFVSIAHELVKRNPDLYFYMVGNGPLHNKVSRLIECSGLADRICLLSAQSDILPLLCATDVMLLPSSYEGAPLTILESLAAGTPVVASDVGAVREYFDDKCRLIPLGSGGGKECQQYVSAVEECLADTRTTACLDPDHDINAVAERYLEIFTEAVHRECID